MKKKYIFSYYENPALQPFDEKEWANPELAKELQYAEECMMVELTDAEYHRHVEAENRYNDSMDFLCDKQEEYGERLDSQ